MSFAAKTLRKYFDNRWVVSNPHVFYRVARGFFRSLVLKRNSLRVIELFPTFRCQMSCSMCSVEKYKSREKAELTLDDYRKLARDGVRLGAFVATFLGGEPLLSPKLEDLVSIFHGRHYYTHIVSNGLLVTRERLRELKRAGLDCLYLSLESMEPEANDAIRGKGHFEKTMENIALAREAGVETGLSTVMFPGKMDQARRVIDFCHRQGINASGGQIAPVGKAEGSETLSGTEFDQVRALIKEYPRLTFDWVFSYFLKPRCPGGREKIGVTCYGDVIGCSYNPLGFGNVLQEPLADIWRRMGAFSQFAKDFPGCISSEDRHYIGNYLEPLFSAQEYPLHYSKHPRISPESEPGLFGGGK